MNENNQRPDHNNRNRNTPPNPIQEQLESSYIYRAFDQIAREVSRVGQDISQTINHSVRVNKAQRRPPGSYPQPPYPNQPPPGVKYQSQHRRPPPRPYAPPPHPRYVPPSQIRPPKPNDVTVKMVREPSATKYVLTAIAAVACALMLPMGSIVGLVQYGAIVGATFILSKSLFKGKKKFIAIPNAKQEEIAKQKKSEKKAESVKQTEPEKQRSKTGNPDVDKIIDEGYAYLKRLHDANDAIPNEQVSECIDRIERASAGIFSYIEQHPNKAPQINKFMSYYLPTTMKLLDAYQRLDTQTYKGENIQGTINDIDRMLYTIANAFEKQLDFLFSEEAMDIATDISVFESMLKQEGFVENEEMPLPKE